MSTVPIATVPVPRRAAPVGPRGRGGPPGAEVLVATSATRRGRSREENEDVALVHGPLLAVADGVGGRPGGGEAARLATDALETAMARPASGVAGALVDAFAEANARVRDAAARDGHPGMSCTLVAAHVTHGVLRVAHVGDSRAYLLRDGVLLPLTEDHTLARAYAAGAATAGGADAGLVAGLGDALVRAVGLEARIEPEVRRVAAHPGDLLLLCSDGVARTLSEPALAGLLGDLAEPVSACAALVRAAHRAGTDDATAVLARLG